MSASSEPGTAPAPPPRPFACLWCGRSWQPRTADDLEARARLCPDCLGRAGEYPFLRFRLRAGLDARAAGEGRPGATAGVPPTHEEELVHYHEAAVAEQDDWYLRRGRYAHGPVHDLAWQMELDAATSWLDALPLRGEIVELAAGTGWWSALLATKGELHAYDAAEAPLDRARDRLLAHRLRAHLHVRDAWAAPDRAVDALFAGFWLGHVPQARLDAFLAIARAWLRPGGRFAAIGQRHLPSSRSRSDPGGRDAGDVHARAPGAGAGLTLPVPATESPNLTTISDDHGREQRRTTGDGGGSDRAVDYG